MGKIDYNEWQQYYGKKDTKKGSINFFSIKSGERALIRFVDDEPEDSEMGLVHIRQESGKFKKYSCIRNPYDPVDACPLCKADVPLQQKMYVKVIEYKNENGEIVPNYCIWERPIGFMSKLKLLQENYDELSQMLYIVTRSGEMQSTTYDVQPANPRKYNIDDYPLNKEPYDGFHVFGRIVKELTYNELEILLGNKVESKQETVEQPAPTRRVLVEEQATTTSYAPKVERDEIVAQQPQRQERVVTPPIGGYQAQERTRKPWEVPDEQSTQRDIPQRPVRRSY